MLIKQEELKSYFLEREITQSELAQELGVSRKTINNWLSGKTKMRLSYDNMNKLYKIINQEEIKPKAKLSKKPKNK